MINCDVKNIKIAKKYSNAFMDTAKNNNCTEKAYNDLIFIVETLKTNKQLFDFLINPIITTEDKKDVITKIFSIHTDKITIDFINLLADNNRINIIEEVLNQFKVTYNENNNLIKSTIISAVELDEAQKIKLQEKLEMKLNKKIIPEYKINKDIIGGFIIEIEDKTINCSIKNKFENMKKQLIKGNKYGNN